MNKSESKYFNTALLMDEALIRLLEVKDYEYITVKEICEKAGVNRSTFYLHYETVNDLLSECLENIKKRFLDSFAKKPNDFIGSIGTVPLDDLVLISSDYLRPYLTFSKRINLCSGRYIRTHLVCRQRRNTTVYRTFFSDRL